MNHSERMEYIKNISTLLKSIFTFLTIIVIMISPGVQETIQSVMENGENFQPVYVNVGDINIKWDIKLELPEFRFDMQEVSAPTFNSNLPFISLVVLVAIILIALSHFHPFVSLFTTLLFGSLGMYFSIQTVEVYKNMLANGSTSWNAANSCFGFLFFLFLVVLANSLLGFSYTITKLRFNNSFSSYICGTLIAAAFAAVGSLVASGLCWVILGLGWAGGVYIFFGISFFVATVLEYKNASIRRNAIEDYDFDYDEDYE